MKQYLPSVQPFNFSPQQEKRGPFFEPNYLQRQVHSWNDGATVKWFAPVGKEFIVVAIDGVDAEAVKELLIYLAAKSKMKTEQCQTSSIEEMQQAVCEISKKQVSENINNEKPFETTETLVEKKAFLANVNAKIEENLCNEQFRVSDLARLLCCCEMQLYRKIKQFSKLSPVNYIRRYRLRRSLQNLQQSELPITQICYNVGFSSLEYFSRSFKKEFGICPSAVRAGQNVGLVQMNV